MVDEATEYADYIEKAELAGQFRVPDPVVIVAPPVTTTIVRERVVYRPASQEYEQEFEELRRRASGTGPRHEANRFSGGRF